MSRHPDNNEKRRTPTRCSPRDSDSENAKAKHAGIHAELEEPRAKRRTPSRTSQSYRLVCTEISRDLTAFTDLREALTAVADAIRAHGDAYCDAKVHHRDINARSILISNGRGLLVDWDTAGDSEAQAGPASITRRIGLWAFRALELQKKPSGEVKHAHYHDLESFYHVLCWLSLKHARHNLSRPRLADIIYRIFQETIWGSFAPSFLRSDTMSGLGISEFVSFYNPPLTELFLQLGYVLRSLYMTPDRINTQAFGDKKLQEMMTKHNDQRLHKLKSDERHKWAEDLIMQSIRMPDSAWGDISYFTHKIPPVSDPLG